MKKLLAGILLSAMLFASVSTEYSVAAMASQLDESANEETLVDETSEELSENTEEAEESDTVSEETSEETSEEVSEEISEEASEEVIDEISDINELETVEEELFKPTEEDYAYVDEARAALQAIIADHDVFGLVYLSDAYELKTEGSAESATAITVKSGQTVFIQDVVLNDNYEIWYKVNAYTNDTNYTGYMQRDFLAISDIDFLAWEEEWNLNFSASAVSMFTLDSTAKVNATTTPADVAQFPSSYQSYLKTLKAAHPNWTFVKFDTGLNWNDVIEAQAKNDVSLVDGRSSMFPTYMRNGVSSQSGWYYTTLATISYYVDPRNWINEDYMFMFELLSYNEKQNKAAVSGLLQNSFMKDANKILGSDNTTEQTYTDIIYEVGVKNNVSPIHLASRLLQEQGSGTSAMISGTFDNNGKNPELKGYYNYFNIGAPTGPNVIIDGLTYAKKMGWDTRYKSIDGGAYALAVNYIKRGQDTLYLQKFDVDNSDKTLYSHQYMQNISAPRTESARIRKAYIDSLYGGDASSTGYKNSTYVFRVPVYNNMPSSASPLPTQNTSICLTGIPSGYATANGSTVYIDGVAQRAIKQNGLMYTASGTGHKVATMYKFDDKGNYTGMYVWLLNWNSSTKCYEVTKMPDLQDMLGYHGFSIRITGNTGIRMKSSVPIATRNKLTTDGINGYKLSEYGTVYMTKANNATLPLVRGGEKTATAMAFGTKDGTHIDNVYEITEDRYRYTVVLTKLPDTQYKTELTFRPYVVLNKNNIEYVVYGPSFTRSMYNLANSYISGNYYSTSSSEYAFLKSIINNAK